MGCKELIDSLHAAGNGKVRALRADAEREVERIRADAHDRVEELRQQHVRQQAVIAEEHVSRALTEAQAAARVTRLRSERSLAERLYAQARTLLPTLRNVGYDAVFESFVRELPSFPWRSVQVNPADEALARTYFPNAEISIESGISGGFIAVSEGDQVRVVNTFERRLESLWETLLPDMLKEVLDAL